MHDMSFIHTPSPTHPQMLISHCNTCGCLIGASPRHSLIAAVEAVHQCIGKLKPPVRSEITAQKFTRKDNKRLPS